MKHILFIGDFIPAQNYGSIATTETLKKEAMENQLPLEVFYLLVFPRKVYLVLLRDYCRPLLFR